MLIFLAGLLQWFLLQQEESRNSSRQHQDIQQHIDSNSSSATEAEAIARALQQAAEEEQSRSPIDIVADVFLIFIGGAAMILVLLAITYFITKLTDLCDDRHRHGMMWPNVDAGGRVVLDDDIDRGSLTRKANLWGLRRAERLAILQEILKSTTKVFVDTNKNRNSGADQNNEMGDIEMGAVSTTTTMPSTSLSASDSESPSVPEGENLSHMADNVNGETTSSGVQELGTTPRGTQPAPTRRESSGEDITDDVGARNYEKLCCICLSEYMDGQSVLTGTQCVHLFHATCCQKWLVQNDLCPYCRKEIVRPSEFRAAAVTLLGEQRVQSLSMAHVEPDRTVPTPVDSGTVISQVNAVDPRSPGAARSPTTGVDSSNAAVGNADSERSWEEVRM